MFPLTENKRPREFVRKLVGTQIIANAVRICLFSSSPAEVVTKNKKICMGACALAKLFHNFE